MLPDARMTYAGRLDPMAEGLLLLLSGTECKYKDLYLGLDKEYEVEVLLGLSSDTGDILGEVQSSKFKVEEDGGFQVSSFTFQAPDLSALSSKLQALVGVRTERYPAYSSKTVQGKPLFQWAREGRLGEIVIPKREIEVKSVELIGTRAERIKTLRKQALADIAKVEGDFRQKECAAAWNALPAEMEVQLVKIRVQASTGTYMRTIAERLGKELEVPALAWSIRRTKLGQYKVD